VHTEEFDELLLFSIDCVLLKKRLKLREDYGLEHTARVAEDCFNVI
jgi:hypothetical protein